MSDLIERLRATNKRVRHSQELRDEAADKIEQLEGALRQVPYGQEALDNIAKIDRQISEVRHMLES